MDPLATLLDLNHAMTTRDREAIATAADAMVGWLEKGGFMPADDVAPHYLTFWWQGMTTHQLKCYFRDLRHVAEMA